MVASERNGGRLIGLRAGAGHDGPIRRAWNQQESPAAARCLLAAHDDFAQMVAS